jgi:hypothetical protein
MLSADQMPEQQIINRRQGTPKQPQWEGIAMVKNPTTDVHIVNAPATSSILDLFWTDSSRSPRRTKPFSRLICNLALFLALAFHNLLYRLVKEFKGSVVGGLDPPGNSILGKAVEGVRATNPLLVGVNDRIEAPLK